MAIKLTFTRSNDTMRPVSDVPEFKEEDITGNDLLVDSDTIDVYVTKKEAMAIPAFASCIDTVSGTVASLPIKLYRKDGESVEEVEGDERVLMLNGDAGDTMTGPEIMKAVVEDYYCSDKGGYIFIDRRGPYSNKIRSLRYVRSEDVQLLLNKYEPIFKQVQYNVGGKIYEPWQFVRVVRATRDGRFGRSIITANRDALSVAYMTMNFERSLVRRGGGKRGFLQSQKHLGKKSLAALKQAWRRFYGSADSNVVIMNDGLQFQEASATSTEMQLNENKQTNADDIYGMFKIPPEVIRNGGTDNASKNANKKYVLHCIMPLLVELVAAMNRSLLLEAEKPTHFFGFDLSEFTKADTKERWEAWKIARDGGFVMPDEVRKFENMPPLGLNYVSMNLRDVLYDVENGQIVVPNTGRVVDLNNLPRVGEAAPVQVEETQADEGGDNFADKTEE